MPGPSAQTAHKHCKNSVISEKNELRTGSVTHEHYLERGDYLHMAIEFLRGRKRRWKLCWKAFVAFEKQRGPSIRRGTCSRSVPRLLHEPQKLYLIILDALPASQNSIRLTCLSAALIGHPIPGIWLLGHLKIRIQGPGSGPRSRLDWWSDNLSTHTPSFRINR